MPTRTSAAFVSGTSKRGDTSATTATATTNNHKLLWGRKKVTNATHPASTTVRSDNSKLESQPSIDSLSKSLPTYVNNHDIQPLKSCLSNKNLVDLLTDDANNNQTTSTYDDDDGSNKMKKSVSFHTIEIREHERTISDNPSVSTGLPVGIGWKSVDSLQCSVADWEEHRPPRRSKSNLLLPAYIREQMIRHDDEITQDDINTTLKQTTKIKMSRHQASKDNIDHPSKTTRVPLFMKFGFNKSTSQNVDKEVEVLLQQSILVEQMRQQERKKFLETMQQQEKQQQQQSSLVDSDTNNTTSNQGTSMIQPTTEPAAEENILSSTIDNNNNFGNNSNCSNIGANAISEQITIRETLNDEMTEQSTTSAVTPSLLSPSPFIANHDHQQQQESDEVWEF